MKRLDVLEKKIEQLVQQQKQQADRVDQVSGDVVESHRTSWNRPCCPLKRTCEPITRTDRDTARELTQQLCALVFGAQGGPNSSRWSFTVNSLQHTRTIQYNFQFYFPTC